MVHSIISARHMFVCLILLLIASMVFLRHNLHRLPFNLLLRDSHSHCFAWKSTDDRLSTIYDCPSYSHMTSLVWTYDGTGLMKYIQWIVTRKLANIKITRLNGDCHVVHHHSFSLIDTDQIFIQVYIMPLSTTFTDQSKCAIQITQIINASPRRINQIYFKRKSIKATAFFQQLDSLTSDFNFTSGVNTSHLEGMKEADYLMSNQWTTIDSEDLIKSNLIDCEKMLSSFLSSLGLNTSSHTIQNIIEHDSHRFIEDATWWDHSQVAQRLLTHSLPSRSPNLTYSDDFYYLHGDRSFIEYLYTSRRCFSEGSFAQLQFDTITNRSSTDTPERCSRKPFDCAFSDLYSFADREQIYEPLDTDHYFNNNTLKCGFAVPSIFDRVRQRYARNHTCQTIIFTLITNCYDPLPQVKGTILSSFCFVALLDTKTIEGYRKFYQIKSTIQWDMIDLGANAIPFSAPAKTVETMKIVGQRLFPLAKWIIWLDGKAQIININQLLAQVQAPVSGAAHPDSTRTSASEVDPTVAHISNRENQFPQRLNNAIMDMRLQEKQYKHDGFYARSHAFKLKMYDIAVFVYRNNHPCIYRYSCGWHNEVNYYSYRGQLSVYYAAVRLNLTSYLHFLPHEFYTTVAHRSVC